MEAAQIICLWIPRVELAVATRSRPPAASPPGAVYDAVARGQPLLACRQDLEAQGMAPGMPLREAQARWPHEPLLPLDAEALPPAVKPVLHVLDTFSPFVEDAGPGQAYMDASGLEPRYGPPRALARRVRQAVIEATGFEPQVGVARSKFLADIAARAAGATGIRVAPRNQTLAGLGRLPVAALGLSPASVQRLRALGILRLHQFAALPAASILHRYGPDGWRAYRGLHGTLSDPLSARRHPLLIHGVLDFEWVEDNPDRLLFAAKMLSDRLAEQLARHHLACRSLDVCWSFETGTQQTYQLRLAEPSAQADTLLRYLRWHLDGLEVGQGVVGLRVRVGDLTDTTGWQLKLLIGSGGRVPDVERRHRALDVIARLRARWGEAVAWQAELTTARRPERAFRRLEVSLPDPDGDPPAGPRVTVPLTLLSPPQPVRVVDQPAPDLNPPLPPNSQPPLPNRERVGVSVDPLPLWEKAGVRVDSPLPLGEGQGEGPSPLPRGGEQREDPSDPLSPWERASVRVDEEQPVPAPSSSASPPRRLVVIDGDGHIVARQAGPWRLHDTPWRPDAVRRDTYQIETTAGAAYLLSHDRSGGHWHLQGVYD